MKAQIVLSTFVFVFILLVGCEKDEVHSPKSSEQLNNIEKPAGIPDSAFALLEELIREEKTKDTPGSQPNARIGDRARIGTIRVIGNKIYIYGARIGELCPTTRVSGDLEFGGGPLISSRVTLYAYGYSLWAWVEFKAKETKGDFSTVKLAKWVKVRDLACTQITQINSSTQSWVDFRGVNAGGEFINCYDGGLEDHSPTGGTLVKKFKIIGDTGGNDISTDTNCDCDTKIYSIDLNTIVVTVQH